MEEERTFSQYTLEEKDTFLQAAKEGNFPLLKKYLGPRKNIPQTQQCNTENMKLFDRETGSEMYNSPDIKIYFNPHCEQKTIQYFEPGSTKGIAARKKHQRSIDSYIKSNTPSINQNDKDEPINPIITHTDKELRTVVHYAAWGGYLRVMEYLIEKGADVYARDVYGQTSLQAAAFEGNMSVVRFLHQKMNIPLDVEDNQGKGLAHQAIYTANPDVIKYLHKHSPELLERRDEGGRYLMHIAASVGAVGIVHCLRGLGFPLDVLDNEGRNIVHYAAIKSRVKIIPYTKRAHMKFFCDKDIYGQTPMHLAAAEGGIQTIQELRRLKMPFNLLDDNGCTILHSAVKNNRLNVVKYIINLKSICFENVKNNEGITPVHMAARDGLLEITEHFVNYTCAINKWTFSDCGLEPWHFAAREGHINILKFYYNKLPAALTRRDKNKLNCFHHAASKDHLETVLFLAGHHPLSACSVVDETFLPRYLIDNMDNIFRKALYTKKGPIKGSFIILNAFFNEGFVSIDPSGPRAIKPGSTCYVKDKYTVINEWEQLLADEALSNAKLTIYNVIEEMKEVAKNMLQNPDNVSEENKEKLDGFCSTYLEHMITHHLYNPTTKITQISHWWEGNFRVGDLITHLHKEIDQIKIDLGRKKVVKLRYSKGYVLNPETGHYRMSEEHQKLIDQEKIDRLNIETSEARPVVLSWPSPANCHPRTEFPSPVHCDGFHPILNEDNSPPSPFEWEIKLRGDVFDNDGLSPCYY